MLLQNMMLRYC